MIYIPAKIDDSDIFASLMTFIGNKISSNPNDDDHEFGHGKAEYIFSMLISISMMVIAFKLLYDSVMSIVNNEHLVFSNNLLIVCVVTIVVKICLYLYCHHQYKKEENILIKSNMLDHRNDCFITILTLIAIIFAKYNIFFVDGIIGIIIGLWILITGIKLFMESYDVLMDASFDNKFDIVRVYVPQYEYNVTEYKYDTCALERDMSTLIFAEETMTKAEAEEKFGIRIVG